MVDPATQPSAKPRRRPRYSGTHPRRFEHKYKELDPQKYPEAIAKVLASGKTPAGMHRPILVSEIMEVLQPKPGQTAVDATLGYGGHTAEILKAILPGGRLIGLDTDPIELPKTEARLRASGYGPEVLTIVHSNFAGLPQVLTRLGADGANLLLADLGCSSMQFDSPARGFSFKFEGPLDLRMNPNKGRPASALLAGISPAELQAVLVDNADEPHAAMLADAILQARAIRPLSTTTELTQAVRGALRRLPKSVQDREGDAPLRRVFQALRIAVNEEFTALDMFLKFLPHCLKPGGRAAMLTFHSGEDRRVKKAFQAGERDGLYSAVAREVTRPSPEEIRSNPRASSAKLRWAIRAA